MTVMTLAPPLAGDGDPALTRLLSDFRDQAVVALVARDEDVALEVSAAWTTAAGQLEATGGRAVGVYQLAIDWSTAAAELTVVAEGPLVGSAWRPVVVAAAAAWGQAAELVRSYLGVRFQRQLERDLGQVLGGGR